MKNKHTLFAPTRIMIPMDLSDGGLVALKVGIGIANKYDSHIDLVTIYEELPSDVYGDVSLYDKEMVHDVKQEINNVLTKIKMSEKVRKRIKITIRKGAAAKTICSMTSRNIIDLIVMATHSRVGVKRMRYGSVTEEVVRLSKVPVLAIKPFEKNRDFKPKKILVPLDLSKRDVLSLTTAQRLASVFKSKIATIHVIPDLSFKSLSLKSPRVLIKDCKERIVDITRNLMLKSTNFVEYGKPMECIVKKAVSNDVDLILLCSRKKGSVFGKLGSVSARVVRYSPCDVLTLPN